MIHSSMIKPNAPVMGSDEYQIATVEKMEDASFIRVKTTSKGEFHLIPLRWVAKVDDCVHLDRTESQVKHQWVTRLEAPTPPPPPLRRR